MRGEATNYPIQLCGTAERDARKLEQANVWPTGRCGYTSFGAAKNHLW